jgi:hypothetical protein
VALLKRWRVPLLVLLVAMMLMPLVIVDTPFDDSGETQSEISIEENMEPAADGENWLEGWSYRMQHVINQSDGAGIGYPIRLQIYDVEGTDEDDVARIANSKIRSDYGDLRFTNSDGSTELDYWIESYTSGGLSDHFISDVGGTFAFYYRNYPSSYYFENRTYTVWQGSGFHPYICYYDHENETWSGDYKVADTPVADDHGAPSMWINSSGYINVVYGSYASTAKHARSTSPYDITGFTAAADMGGGDLVTYNKLSYDYDNDVVHWTYRATSGTSYDLHYRNSTDDGETWSSAQVIIDLSSSNVPYQGISGLDRNNNELYHFTFLKYNSSSGYDDVYYAYLNVTSGQVYNASDVSQGTGVAMADLGKIKVASETANDVDVPAVHVDSSGVPYITYTVRTAGGGGEVWWVYWNTTESDWTTPEKISDTDADHYAAGRDFIIYDSTNVTAFISEGKNLTKWEWDGNSWSRDVWVKNVTTGPRLTFSIVPAHWGDGLQQWHNDTFQIAFCEYQDSPQYAYAYGVDGIIQRDTQGLAYVWVNVSDDLSSQDSTIYVYYGNPSATTTSNGTDTFELFDDFEDGSIDWTNKWASTDQAFYSESSGQLVALKPDLNSKFFRSKNGYGNDVQVRYSVRTNDATDYSYYSYYANNSAVFGLDKCGLGTNSRYDVADDGAHRYIDSTGTQLTWGYDVGINGQLSHILWWRASNATIILQTEQGSSNWTHSATNASYTGNDNDRYFKILNWETTGGKELYVEWVFIDSWVSPEPSHHTWSEEELGYYDYVDQISTEDAQADIGTHSSFSDQQSAPDSTYDTLTEGDEGVIGNNYYDWFQNYGTDIDSYPDVGTETSPANAQDLGDSDYMNLQEADVSALQEFKADSWTDSANEWTDDANAYDGNWGTAAYDLGVAGGDDYPSNYASGFDSGSSGSGTITQVDIIVRLSAAGFSGASDWWQLTLDVGSSTDNALSGSPMYNQALTNLTYSDVTEPNGGGWTWAEIRAAEIHFDTERVGGSDNADVYIYEYAIKVTTSSNYELDFEYQWTNANYSETYEEVCINVQTYQQGASETLKAWEWTGSTWASLGTFYQNGWNNFTASYITGSTYYIKVNDTDQSGDSTQDSWNIDSIILHTWSTTINYRLDLEEQWTAAQYDQDVELLCIKWGSVPSSNEKLNISVWNSTDSSWNFIFEVNSTHDSSWTNISITTWLLSSTFTIQFEDTNQTGDSDTQDTWEKDSCMLWTYPSDNVAPLVDVSPIVDNPDDTDNLYAQYKWYYFEVNVSDANGAADISHVEFTISSNDRVTEFWTIKFNNSNNEFTNETDITDTIELDTVNSEYNEAGNDIDLTFWVKIDWGHTDSTDIDGKVYVEDNSDLTNTTWYEMDNDVETRLEMSSGPTLNDGSGTADRGEFDDTITATGTLVYYGGTAFPLNSTIDVWCGASEYGTNVGPWNMTSYEHTTGTFSNSVYADDAVGLDTHTFKAVEQDAGWSGTNLFQSAESDTYITDRLNITIVADEENPDNDQQVNFTLTVEYDYDATTCTTYTIQIARNGSTWYTFDNSNKTLFNDTNSDAVYLYNATSDNDGVSETTHGLSTSNPFLTNTVTVTWSVGAQSEEQYLFEIFQVDESNYNNYSLEREYYDSITVVHDTNTAAGFSREYSEAVTVADGVISLAASFLQLIFETFAAAGTILFAVGKKFEEALGVQESIVLAASFSRVYYEAFTIDFSYIADKSIQKFLFESVTVGVWYSLQKDMVRSLFENFTVSVWYGLEKDMTRNLFESITLNETEDIQKVIQKFLFESVTVGVWYSLQKDMTRNLFENFTVAFDYNTTSSLSRTFSEGITFNETEDIQKVIQKFLFESITVTFSYALQKDLSRILSEGIVFGVDYSTTADLSRTYYESFVINETCYPEKNPTGVDEEQYLFETITVAEVIANAANFVNNMGESFTVSDVIATTFNAVQNMNEGLTISESYNTILAANRALSESLSIVFDYSISSDFARVFSEGVVFNESIDVEKVIQKFLFESVTVGVWYSLQKDMTRNLFESFTVSMWYGLEKDMTRNLFENITFNESIDAQKTIQMFLFESVTVGVWYALQKDMVKSLFESVTFVFTCATDKEGDWQKILFETVTSGEWVRPTATEPPTTGTGIFYELFLSLEMWSYLGPLGLVIGGYIVINKDRNLGIIWFVVECLFIAQYLTLVNATPEYWWHIFILLFGGMFTITYPLWGERR